MDSHVAAGAPEQGKARISAYSELVAEAEAASRGGERTGDRLEITIPAGPRLGDVVVEASAVSKGFGAVLLFEDMSFLLPPGAIVGVIGPEWRWQDNPVPHDRGIGDPDRGAMRIGDTVQLAYVDQSREELEAGKTVFEEAAGGQDRILVGGRELHGRAVPGQLRLQGQRPAEEGWRAPPAGSATGCSLAKVLRAGGNVLLLDEPTNDLDVDTLALWRRRSWPSRLRGRDQPRPVVPGPGGDPCAGLRGDSQVQWWEGNFSDYEADRHKRLGVDADQPHRIRYKPLVRG